MNDFINLSAVENSPEISTALSERKAGNITGAGSPAKQRLSEQDIHDLSEYIQTLK